MSSSQPLAATSRRPIRLWPGVVIVTVALALQFLAPIVDPDMLIYGVLGGAISGVLVLAWWVFFSRAPWSERLAAVALTTVAFLATRPLLDKSIATGAMGMLFPFLMLPWFAVVFVVWAVATRRLTGPVRLLTMAAGIVAACGFWTLVRTGGFGGNFAHDFAWRWTETPEERLLAQTDVLKPLPPAPAAETAAVGPAVPGPSPSPAAVPAETTAPASTAANAAAPSSAVATPTTPSKPAAVTSTPAVAARPVADWPGFRGRGRDSIVRQVTRIATDWAAKPPVQMWRRPVGPGWSSFAVNGNVFYTQEQRGDDEVVSAYHLDSGDPVWRHRDTARFWESNGGAGPRGTPTLSGGRVYALGATGLVNALDARTGAVVWSRNAAADTGATLPTWGFSGSPLVIDDEVVVAASGSLVSYDVATGGQRWRGPKGGASYSSPQLMTVGGVPQVLLLSASGLTSVSPRDGSRLWEHEWKGYPIVQPARTPDGDVLIAINESSGTRRLAASQGPAGWTVEERWTSNGLKPYFNDFVVHEGHAFGFDGRMLSCIDLKDGARKWKGGRYGGGQLVLLPAQNVLLVLSEEGELALVGATTDQFRELARVPAIEGKTWNHPVLVGDILLVRNSEQMAAFRLPIASPQP
jgi:outer membrane protein assembly factor BamB